jgi:hypothetical protein
MLPHQAQIPFLFTGTCSTKRTYGPDAAIAPERVVRLERLNTREQGGITPGHLERSVPRQPSRPSLFLA